MIKEKHIYFNTYTEAVQYAVSEVNKKHNVIWCEDCPPRPKDGETTRLSMQLVDNKKYLHIQVYNRGQIYNSFELNYYIN